MVKYNFDKLKGKIKEVFNTQNEFADALGIAPNTLSSKLNNQSDFSSNEISKATKLLNISSPVEAWNIFFTQEVEKLQQNNCDKVQEGDEKMEDVLYPVAETAKLLKTNSNYVYELIKRGLLPALKLGSYKVRKTALTNFLEKNEGKDLTDLDNIISLNMKGDDKYV